MSQTPFTVSADIDLGGRVEPYRKASGYDVRIEAGSVPETLGSTATKRASYEVAPGRFLMRVPNGLIFYVEDGSRVTYQQPSNVTDREVMLFLLGSAWGALCYQRNLLPIHASGIIHHGNVYAFTGPSGAGKSTLCAALSHRGHPFFADDVLVIDPNTLSTDPVCYAGQKDLKLWSDALALTNAKKKTPVREAEGFEKFYANPAVFAESTKGYLRQLYLLTSLNDKVDGEPITVAPIKGVVSARKLLDAVYRRVFANDIVGQKMLFEWLAKLIQHVDVYRFDRPMNRSQFDDGVDFMSDRIFSLARGETQTTHDG